MVLVLQQGQMQRGTAAVVVVVVVETLLRAAVVVSATRVVHVVGLESKSVSAA